MSTIEIVLGCARKLQESSGVKLWDTIDADALYFHPRSALDSLAIVDLLVAVITAVGGGVTIEQILFGPGGIPKTLGELAAKVDKLRGHDAAPQRLTKLVILDCDDTLWEGVALMGPVMVRANVCEKIMRWSNSGCLHAICSKNEIETVAGVLKNYPNVNEHITTQRINWQDKGENVVSILNELNLLPENAVFLDNDPFERGRVCDAVPGIWCPDIAIDGSDIDNALALVDVTIPQAVTDEDRNRAELYRQEAQRKQALAVASSYDDWLRGLGIQVTVRKMEQGDWARAQQLVDKAHQWKLTDNDDLYGNRTYVAEYTDKYGGAGIIGVAVIAFNGNSFSISQFVMSCRVIGRGVEDLIYNGVARVVGKEFLPLYYKETEHNTKAVEWAKVKNSI